MSILAQNYQIPNYPPGYQLSFTTLGEVISRILTYAITFAGILMLVMIVLGGYMLMISGGNPEKVSAGKNKITMGVIGFLLVFATWFIIRIIEIVFGIQILT